MSSLFKPGRLGGLDLKNRIVVSPMCQYSGVSGVTQIWHTIHIGSLMMSGADLVIMEATSVDRTGLGTPGCLGLYTDEQEQALTELVSRVRTVSGAKLGLQLTHSGRKASTRTIPERWRGEPLPREDGAWEPVAPSAIAYDQDWQTPKELTEAAIEAIIAAFADAARRTARAGFDLVEIHGAHGYLIHSFLSPITNKRTDHWGGSTGNRNRFALEVARAVRAVWPDDRALGFRMNSTDWRDDGSTLDDAIALASELQAAGVDYVVMSAGNIAPGIAIPPATHGHQVPFAAAVRRATGMKVMAVGMIVEPQQADTIISSGDADYVAVARAMLDNPRWGIHAAAALGEDIAYPPQYIRARPNNWLGFSHVHPDAKPVATTLQLDRPKSVSAWDRPPVA